MKCFECGQDAGYEYYIVPKSLGGTKTVPLCEVCHEKVRKYYVDQEFYETTLSLQEILRKYGPGYNFDTEVPDQELQDNLLRLQEILSRYDQ
jgi:hypothetical protein